MSDLDPAMELMHTAPRRFDTLRAARHAWSDTARRDVLLDEARYRQEGAGDVVFLGIPSSPVRKEERLWLARRSCFRVETETRASKGPRRQVIGGNGGRSWTETDGRVQAGHRRRHRRGRSDWPRSLVDVVDPWHLAGQLDLRSAGTAVVAGRSGARLRGVLRPRLFFPPLPQPTIRTFSETVFGCEYELVVDLERGVLLRFVESIGEEQFEVAEVSEVAFDEPLPDRVFTAPEPTHPPRTPEEPSSEQTREQRVGIDEAASLAPFTVLVPTRVPEGASLATTFFPGTDDPDVAAGVTLSYRFPAATHRLELHQGAVGSRGWGWWRPVTIDGQRFLVALGRDPWPPVLFERHGTAVSVQSDLALDTVLQIAASCVPVQR